MCSMFYRVSSLEQLEVYNFCINKGTNIKDMFAKCSYEVKREILLQNLIKI